MSLARYLLWVSVIAITGLAIASPAPADEVGTAASATPDVSPAERLKQHVVAIYDENNRLLGSGAVVSTQGLILTAKHILEFNVEGQDAPAYRLSVKVRTNKDTELRNAALVATHPHMDIALIHSPGGSRIPPIFVGDVPKSASAKWFAIGHPRGINDVSAKLFDSKSGDWSSLQNDHGRIKLGIAVDTGMSGGPLIVENKIVGVVSHTQTTNAIIEPVKPALDHLRLLGFSANKQGLIIISDHVGRLAGKIEDYERILSEIQIDVQWMCQITGIWPATAKQTMPGEIELRIVNKKRLRSQPDMYARVEVNFQTYVQPNGAASKVKLTKKNDYEWVKGKTNYAIFDKFDEELAAELATHHTNLVGKALAIGPIEIEAFISTISGKGYIRRDPRPYRVCCSIPSLKPSATPPGRKSVTRTVVEAQACPARQIQ